MGMYTLPLLNGRRSRALAKIDDPWDDDGFWFFGYGNDPKRRRYIRRVEKQRWRKQLDKTPEDC